MNTDEKLIEEMRSRMFTDEALVPEYTVPSPLLKPDGTKVASAYEWTNSQRRYVLGLFEEYMYGKIPPRPDEMRFEVLDIKDDALDGLAVRKQIRAHFKMSNGKSHHMDILLYLPKNAKGSVPAFLGLNFKGNAAGTFENDIPLSAPYVDPASNPRYIAPVGENTRGAQAGRWQLEMVLKRGYATATVYYGDIFPDLNEGFKDSIYAMFYDDAELGKKEKTFGAISAWAWGLSRAMDYLESDPAVDSRKVIVHGHSRLGKTALWAGANDPRFAMVISNDSGCAGAALKRRCFGENIEWLYYWRPYWFHHNYGKFSRREAELPVDQNMLLALIAPRPLYVASAEEDPGADPKGEFLSAVHSVEVYKLFGSNGLNTDRMPGVSEPVHADIGYHIRPGEHDITETDWRYFLDFADKTISCR